MTREVADEAEMRALGAEIAPSLVAGDVVFLWGELGAGKTTLVRGLVAALGHVGPVRSPTFNLLQTFDTDPPILHADLYRLRSVAGLGLEDYLDTHLCLVEWPDRAPGLAPTWQIEIAFAGSGRQVTIEAAR